MLVAYLESIKYVGHMWPVALVRLVFGYKYVCLAVDQVQIGYLEHAYVSEYFNLDGAPSFIPAFYFELFRNLIQSQWLAITYVFISLEILIGVSYIVGFCVRPIGILGMIFSFHIFLFFDIQYAAGQLYMFYIHLLFCLLGAGRCLGLDYYFFKSRRGIFW